VGYHDIHSVLEIAETVAFLDNKQLCWHGTVEEMRQSDNKLLKDFVTASEYKI
jgi:phospholipid/cholesterol/gamma-HCH transport system ATP-binding protein